MVGTVKSRILHQCAKFCEDQSNHCWDIAILAIFKRVAAASWIFKTRHAIVPNFIKIGRTVVEIWQFKMAAVRHLGFVGSIFGPPTKTTWWSPSLCKIWLESIQYFWYSGSLNILHVWLENAYSYPQNWRFYGISPTKWAVISKKPQKGTPLRESASFESSTVQICWQVWQL